MLTGRLETNAEADLETLNSETMAGTLCVGLNWDTGTFCDSQLEATVT